MDKFPHVFFDEETESLVFNEEDDVITYAEREDKICLIWED